jgi:hypothetical protein
MKGFLALAIACLVACDPLVDTSYSGEPLVRLQGVVSSTQGAEITPTGAKGAALWQTASLWGLTDFTRLPLSLEFPVFWFDVMAQPRDEALFQVDLGEPAIAEGYLHIVKPTTGTTARGDDFLATEYEHALIYVTAELPPGGATAQYLGGDLAPGFHVVARTSVATLTAPQQVLVERCVALATTVPPDLARASCTAQRLYRLDPAFDDLTTLLRFRVELPSP